MSTTTELSLQLNEEEKLITKYKSITHKQYPGAYLVGVDNNRYTVIYDNPSTLETIDILDEYLFHPQLSKLKAWELASKSAGTSQLFNRTSPHREKAVDSDRVGSRNKQSLS